MNLDNLEKAIEKISNEQGLSLTKLFEPGPGISFELKYAHSEAEMQINERHKDFIDIKFIVPEDKLLPSSYPGFIEFLIPEIYLLFPDVFFETHILTGEIIIEWYMYENHNIERIKRSLRGRFEKYYDSYF